MFSDTEVVMYSYEEIIGILGGGAWSPYLAGALIGVLTWFTFSLSDKPIGASSAYATLAGLVGKALAPRHTMKLAYYQETPPKVSWELVFVLSAILGSFVSATSGGEYAAKWVPDLWSMKHPVESYPLVAVMGGVLMAFGARLAGGCTSGHGISGALQGSLGSWISLICFFLGGILAVQLIY